MKESWLRLGGDIVYDAGIFRVRKDRYEFRGEPAGHPFHVLEAGAWVNIVALTPDDEVVLVRQYRHGVAEDSLEVPGGLVDPGDDDPAQAAARELLEETGYAGAPLEPIGTVSSNPAILTNRTFSFLTRDARRIAEPAPDEHEDLVVELYPAAEIPELLRNGEMHHALSVCALSFYWIGHRG
jgi:8-oxo-dGTP pyrophosphatase MutT (NUDIX family)